VFYVLVCRLDHGVTIDESDSEEIEDEEEGVEHLKCGNVPVIRNKAEIEQLVDDRPAMVYLNALVALAEVKVAKICSVKGCEAVVHISSEVVSSAVYLRWVINLQLSLKDLSDSFFELIKYGF
jgi:hypothetical protein